MPFGGSISNPLSDISEDFLISTTSTDILYFERIIIVMKIHQVCQVFFLKTPVSKTKQNKKTPVLPKFFTLNKRRRLMF